MWGGGRATPTTNWTSSSSSSSCARFFTPALRMAEPVDGDLGLRLYDPPSPRAQSAAVRSELAAAPLEPTSTAAARAEHLVKPAHARTETLTRRISFPHLDLARDTLLNLRRTVLTFAVVEFDIDSGPVSFSFLSPPGLAPRLANLTLCAPPPGGTRPRDSRTSTTPTRRPGSLPPSTPTLPSRPSPKEQTCHLHLPRPCPPPETSKATPIRGKSRTLRRTNSSGSTTSTTSDQTSTCSGCPRRQRRAGNKARARCMATFGLSASR